MSDPTRPDGELSFDRAIPADGDAAPASPQLNCANCARAITATYHTVNGEPVCSSCRMKLENATGGASSPAVLLKAALFGTGAAIVGAVIYWAVMRFLNLEIGLVAILTGFMVGKAVRAGAGGRGGRLLQAGSALLVYLSVAGAYFPFALGAALEGDGSTVSAELTEDSLRARAALFDSLMAADSAAEMDSLRDAAARGELAATPAESSLLSPAADSADAAAAAAAQVNPFVAIVSVLLLAAALPILAIVGSLPGGLISALIIGFGMVQAWQLTGGAAVKFAGPFRVGGTPPAPPTL